MGKAIGIGGVFIHMKGSSKALFDWYNQYLGLDFSAFGTGFLEGEQLMVLTFKRDNNPHMPFLNLRVDDLDSIISRMKANKVEILSDITAYDYGSFATFKDPFGNVIELWEAKPEAYRKMVKEEIEKYQNNKQPKI